MNIYFSKEIDKLDLDGLSIKILMGIFSRMHDDNIVDLNDYQIAEEMDLSDYEVNQAIKELMKHKILIEGSKRDPYRVYLVNPDLAFVHNDKNRKRAYRKYKNLKMEKAGISSVIMNKNKPVKENSN